MFLDANGEEVKDEKLQKLANDLAPLTEKFTKECHRAAEEHGVKLTVVVKISPATD